MDTYTSFQKMVGIVSLSVIGAITGFSLFRVQGAIIGIISGILLGVLFLKYIPKRIAGILFGMIVLIFFGLVVYTFWAFSYYFS